MTNDFPEIWQSQSTTGGKVPREQFLRRLERSKSRGRRRHYSVLAILLLGFAGPIALTLFPSHPRILLWACALDFMAWVLWCWYSPKDWLVLRSESPMVDRNLITLDLDGRTTPCLDFYRRELKGHYDAVRLGRGVVVASILAGLVFIPVAWMLQGNVLSPMLWTAGLVFAIGGALRYLYLRREYPNVHAEFQDAERFWPDEKS
jgi:hypothetical protein